MERKYSGNTSHQYFISWRIKLLLVIVLNVVTAWPSPDEYFNSIDKDIFSSPLITPTAPDVTLEVNTNYTLRCQSKSPVKWVIPELHDTILNYHTEKYSIPDPQQPFGIQLDLYNITVEYVRFYYCVDENFNSETIEELEGLVSNYSASKIYIFVNDLDNLIVPQSFPVISAVQFSEVMIPCKPTTKNIDVILYTPDGESYCSETTKFDPKNGFAVKILGFENQGIYVCRPKFLAITNPEEEIQLTVHMLLSGNKNHNNNNTSNNFVTTAQDLMVDVIRNNNETEFLTTAGIPEIENNNKSYENIENKLGNSIKKRSNSQGRFRKSDGILAVNDYIKLLASTTFTPHTTYIEKPIITSPSLGHVFEGRNFNLTCSVELGNGVMFNIVWTTPFNNLAFQEKRAEQSETIREESPKGYETGKRALTIYNARKDKDTGHYVCEIIDHAGNRNNNSFLMRILSEREAFINLTESSGRSEIKGTAGKSTKIAVFYRAYPKPTLMWYNNENMTIPITNSYNDKYRIDENTERSILTIKNLTLQDSGIYALRARNGFVDEVINFKLLVKDKPIVRMENIYVQSGEEARVQCESFGYPKPDVKWSFSPCHIKPKWPTCNWNSITSFDAKQIITIAEDDTYSLHELRFFPQSPGVVTCSAKNVAGENENKAEILIGDLTEPVAVYGIDDNRKIAVGDEVILTCAALAYNYSADLLWYKDNVLIEPNSDMDILSSHSDYSYRKILKFKSIQYDHSGLYECRARAIPDDGKYEKKMLDVKVHDPVHPRLDFVNPESNLLERNLGDFLELKCKASGIPKPHVIWFKDNERIDVNRNESRISLKEDGTILQVPFIKPEDEGQYKCLVSNRLGSVEKFTKVKIINMPGIRLGWILVICGAFLLLLLLIIYLFVRFIKERKLRRQMKAAGLANFEEGAVECINPALSLDEQADLLPYDRRFEFPKEKLKLGKQLGAGAFGVVLKATAEEILPEEKETTVAVKMVKKTADNEVIKALVSELKIMVHLGQHLNVVNLLGAVTKNIAKREVMVIVEYCRYGNLQNFLLKNRKRFINQINPKTDQIDPLIANREQRCSTEYEYNSGRSEPETPGQGYVRQSELSEYMGGNIDSCNTEQTLISTGGGDGSVLSNNSVQPAWRSNYRPDGMAQIDITTSDLVSWAFQVARGMDYLASRKVLHGDLAARNILLCDGNVVKICDFGLARSMYRSDNYKKQEGARLPIKWLAIESLGDQIFSTYSDVWSFGIVLWEFFSLAKVPYPGMEADQTLYLKLKDGYRMEKPEYANQELYDIMLECWGANPESRPLFTVLEKKLAKLLSEEVSNHYIDLNEPYLRVNSLYYKTGQIDYLAVMNSRAPDELAPEVPEAPRYVNGHVKPDTKGVSSLSSDYLQMSPKSGTVVFNPCSSSSSKTHDIDIDDDTDYIKADRFNHTDFFEPNSPTISNNLDGPLTKNRNLKKTGIPEEVPMLKQTHSDSDTEISSDAKTNEKKFSRFDGGAPSLNDHKIVETNLGIDQTSYVNVLHSNEGSRKGSPGKDAAFTNPSYLVLQKH